MASIHSGILTGLPPVNECRDDLNLSKDYGVDEPSTIEVSGKRVSLCLFKFEYGGFEYEVYRHPQLFITEDVKAWYNSYVSTEFCKHESYKDQSPLWLDLYHIYNRYYNKFSKIKAKMG